MLLPEYVLEGWTTTLGPQVGNEEVIALYRDHATHEQVHAEFKTDMDLSRLPSGKFATNHLVCALAAVAMNPLNMQICFASSGSTRCTRATARYAKLRCAVASRR